MGRILHFMGRQSSMTSCLKESTQVLSKDFFKWNEFQGHRAIEVRAARGLRTCSVWFPPFRKEHLRVTEGWGSSMNKETQLVHTRDCAAWGCRKSRHGCLEAQVWLPAAPLTNHETWNKPQFLHWKNTFTNTFLREYLWGSVLMVNAK